MLFPTCRWHVLQTDRQISVHCVQCVQCTVHTQKDSFGSEGKNSQLIVCVCGICVLSLESKHIAYSQAKSSMKIQQTHLWWSAMRMMMMPYIEHTHQTKLTVCCIWTHTHSPILILPPEYILVFTSECMKFIHSLQCWLTSSRLGRLLLPSFWFS